MRDLKVWLTFTVIAVGIALGAGLFIAALEAGLK